MRANVSGITYETLCPTGTRHADETGRAIAETRRVAGLLSNAEEQWYHQIPYYRDQLATTKDEARKHSIALQRHVAHCTDGCKRATDGTRFAARVEQSQWERAPHRLKPELPGATALAAMLTQGQTLDGLAAVYDRSPFTIGALLTNAGYSTRDGRPARTPATQTRRPTLPAEPTPDESWQADALCAQTDPDGFFPDRGGSTRESKKVCAKCLVRRQCLSYALTNEERFGVWGGKSERERRQMVRDTKAAS
jgi:WhiB family redox-sensing transcriptional regulator